MKKTIEIRHTETAAKAGIGFGCALAIVLSWTANKSIGWAIIHGLLSWLYVIYYLFTQNDWTWL
jgi:hypothetical protein